MEVTQNQRNAAEVLVRRIKDRKIDNLDAYEKSVQELFYFVLKTFAKECDKYQHMEKIGREFTIFLNYKIEEKRIMITNIANHQEFIFLDVESIKDAKKVMKEVADIFNDLDYYQAEFHPYSRDGRGTLTVYINT